MKLSYEDVVGYAHMAIKKPRNPDDVGYAEVYIGFLSLFEDESDAIPIPIPTISLIMKPEQSSLVPKMQINPKLALWIIDVLKLSGFNKIDPKIKSTYSIALTKCIIRNPHYYKNRLIQ